MTDLHQENLKMSLKCQRQPLVISRFNGPHLPASVTVNNQFLSIFSIFSIELSFY